MAVDYQVTLEQVATDEDAAALDAEVASTEIRYQISSYGVDYPDQCRRGRRRPAQVRFWAGRVTPHWANHPGSSIPLINAR